MVVKNNPDLTFAEDDLVSDEINLPAKENIIIYSLDYKKLFAFHLEPDIPTAQLSSIAKKGEEKFSMGAYDAVGIRYKTNANKEFIVIAKGHFMSDELIRLRNIMIINFFLCLIVVAMSGYYFSGQALRPIVSTMNELDEILPADLTKRINTGKNKDEISRLAISFNKLLDRIEEAFNVQKGFLSNVSHELRNPLASIIASIQVTLSKDRTEKEYKQCLESILNDASGLEQTSTHLMQLARLTAGSDKILLGPVRLDEIVWQSKAQVKKNNAGYSFSLDADDFPGDAALFEIIANEALLKTAFTNLMENACKFSPDHKASLKLYMTQNNEAAVGIGDTAPIINQKEVENIFKPFYRSTSTNKINGSGIGLSLVASILKIHNARLTITESDKGNIFTVYFKHDS
ncbi:MAG: HAMP domain-containing histidine kinase [Saprospiraceae bacterium]|nr:HAMP domain-containing histidine kinase [Saprospiraceae bacterium]